MQLIKSQKYIWAFVITAAFVIGWLAFFTPEAHAEEARCYRLTGSNGWSELPAGNPNAITGPCRPDYRYGIAQRDSAGKITSIQYLTSDGQNYFSRNVTGYDASGKPTGVTNTGFVSNSTEITCNGLSTCLAVLVYYVGPGLAGYVAYIGAYFFSIVVQLSLNSTAYALDFLSQGWTTVRDLANMAFIFILIYIALTVMFQAETAGTIKTLATVIVIALLVNFSFFFTRVVIDAGNILALQFYNAIDGSVAPTINGVKDLSASLMGATGPQVLLSQQMFSAIESQQGALATLGLLTVIYLAVAVMLWMLFFAFLQVGIKFLLRIVGLWFLLIASPLAFVARTMKQTKGYFDQWLKYLVEFSLYPAIFLFMFLILTRFASTLMNQGTSAGTSGNLLNAIGNSLEYAGKNGEGATSIIATVGIRMGFVLALMYVALRVADWIVKEGSSIGTSITNRIGGAGRGLARFGGGLPIRGISAGAGALGRTTLGWGGNTLNRSTFARGLESRGGLAGLFGRGLREAGKYAGNKTYDPRNISGASKVLSAGGALDIGKGTKDGYIKRTAEIAATKEKRAKDLEPTAVEKDKALAKAKSDFKYKTTKAIHEWTIQEAQSQLADAKVNEITKKAAQDRINNAKAALAENEKYLSAKAKELSGEGLKKVAGEALLRPLNIAAGNPGFITRSSREAANKLFKEKSKEQKLADAVAEYAKDEHKPEEKKAPEKKESAPSSAPAPMAMQQHHTRQEGLGVRASEQFEQQKEILKAIRSMDQHVTKFAKNVAAQPKSPSAYEIAEAASKLNVQKSEEKDTDTKKL